MMKRAKGAIILFTALLSLAACQGSSASSLGLLSSSDSVSSAASSASSEVSSAPDIDQNLPSYEKIDRMANYKDDDNYRDYYHIFVHSFADSNGDGIGDLNGITAKLDYLRKKGAPHAAGSLGINGIYLSPIQPSSSYHKYSIDDYEAVDSTFGSLADFDKLIKEAHDRGIKVIMDLVLNHSSDYHPLFRKAWKALIYDSTCDEKGRPTQEAIAKTPEIDYFRFIQGGYSFDNYSNRIFAGPGKWNYEGFASEMPDWNLDNQTVRSLHQEYMKFWLDRGVDGFRLDAVQSLYGEVSIDLNKNYEYINFINKTVKDLNPQAYIVAEGPWSLAGSLSYMTNTSIDSYFNFNTSEMSIASSYGPYLNHLRYDSGLSSTDLKNFYKMSGFESANALGHLDAYFNSNHDIGRIANQFMFADTARLAQLKFHLGFQNLFKGNYFMYYGDEMGLMGVKKGDDDMYCRSPFRWGDSYTTAELEGGLNAASEKYFPTLDKQLIDSSSLFNFCRQLMKIKDYHPEILRGEGTIKTDLTEKKILNIEKTYNSVSLSCLINYSSQEATTSLEEAVCQGQIVNCLSTDGTYAELSGANLKLPPLSITFIQ